jgi:uncharacterized protein (TIGR01777 family)
VNVLVSGASGLVGSALARVLSAEKHRVGTLSRRGAVPGHVFWAPGKGELDAGALEAFGPDAVVHLAGESIAGGRWTPDRKRRILESRVAGTELLAGSLAAMARPPRVLVSASAVGFYGDRKDALLDEEGGAGSGFLAGTCRAWEGATAKAAERGIRVIHLRIGMVLDARGGALARMLPFFRLGLGGPMGGGRQSVSWIALPDLVGAIRHLLLRDGISGPVNATSPNPATNAEFARVLGRILSRPAFLPVPAFALRLAFGEMADELLLQGARVVPSRLRESGFTFRYPTLEGALRAALER